VTGTIRARQVYLCATSKVNGDVFNEALAIETGAQLNGAVRREKDPLKNAAIKIVEEEMTKETAKA
jgi:cytoskeletal protein CcmA (bactofilin family)